MVKIGQPLSNNLEALMAEWLTFKAIDLYRRGPYSCDPNNDYQKISNAELFETIQFFPSGCWFLSLIYPSLLDLKVLIRVPNSTGLRAGSGFQNIGSTIAINLKNLRTSSLYYIMNEEEIPSIAGVPFRVESGCEPLMSAFINENYARKTASSYMWKSKFERLFGHETLSEDAKIVKIFEKIDSKISAETREILNKAAAENQLINAVYILKKLENIKFDLAKSFLENYLFPETWGKPKPDQILKWYKANRKTR